MVQEIAKIGSACGKKGKKDPYSAPLARSTRFYEVGDERRQQSFPLRTWRRYYQPLVVAGMNVEKKAQPARVVYNPLSDGVVSIRRRRNIVMKAIWLCMRNVNCGFGLDQLPALRKKEIGRSAILCGPQHHSHACLAKSACGPASHVFIEDGRDLRIPCFSFSWMTRSAWP